MLGAFRFWETLNLTSLDDRHVIVGRIIAVGRPRMTAIAMHLPPVTPK
jgi:hypothetical protein